MERPSQAVLGQSVAHAEVFYEHLRILLLRNQTVTQRLRTDVAQPADPQFGQQPFKIRFRPLGMQREEYLRQLSRL